MDPGLVSNNYWGLSMHSLPGSYGVANYFPVGMVSREPDESVIRESAGFSGSSNGFHFAVSEFSLVSRLKQGLASKVV